MRYINTKILKVNVCFILWFFPLRRDGFGFAFYISPHFFDTFSYVISLCFFQAIIKMYN